MKVTKFSLLFAAMTALLFSFGCSEDEGDDNNDKQYRITLTCGDDGTATATINGKTVTEAPQGSMVTIAATPNAEREFSQWAVIGGDVSLDDHAAATTTFKMPSSDVEITADFSMAFPEDIFPKIIDPVFRSYCERFDANSDGILTKDEVLAVTNIDLRSSDVTSLVGIEYFTELLSLNCDNNKLANLNVNKNTQLKEFNCIANQLTSLDVSKNTQLITLQCSNNELTSLDVSNNTLLKDLICHSNKLTSLDVSNTQLVSLYCNWNQLASLDVSNNTQLITLWCYENKIPSLDVSNNAQLELLNCYGNELKNLDVSKNTKLKELNCQRNQLVSLIGLNTQLLWLYCQSNQLTGLDVSNCMQLISLHCDENQLTNLDVSNNRALYNLYCQDNKLMSLDISNIKSLNTLYCSDNPNLVTITVWNDFDINNPRNSLGSINKDSHTTFVRVQ